MVSIMNEALELKVGLKVLEVGAGSGWHACTVAEIVAPSNRPRDEWGHVYTLEVLPELAAMAHANMEREGYDDRVTILCRDGSLGYPEEAPFDRILVTAAAPAVPPPLTEQLASGGVMVIPVGSMSFYQTLKRLRKRDSRVLEEGLGGVAFVPLRGRYGHGM
jgi:protein-L-isoaspartate(D-aspartate) O-methyltransferase